MNKQSIISIRNGVISTVIAGIIWELYTMLDKEAGDTF